MFAWLTDSLNGDYTVIFGCWLWSVFFFIIIISQALVQLLRTEGVQLGDKPVPPGDTIKLRPKRYDDQPVNFDDMPEWVSYW